MSDKDSGDEKVYRVGYGRPPLSSRWTSDHQPKRRGSRKGVRNFKTEFLEFMDELIWVTGVDGTRRRITRRMSLLRQAYGRGHNKESGTALRLLEIDMKISQPNEPAPSKADVSADDEAIMADFYRRAIEDVRAAEAAEAGTGPVNTDTENYNKETNNGDA